MFRVEFILLIIILMFSPELGESEEPWRAVPSSVSAAAAGPVPPALVRGPLQTPHRALPLLGPGLYAL